MLSYMINSFIVINSTKHAKISSINDIDAGI